MAIRYLKAFLILASFTLVIISCKKDDNEEEEIKTYPIEDYSVSWKNGIVEEGDTVYIPIGCYSPFIVNSEQNDLSVKWRMEDTVINESHFFRKFENNGLYEINVTISTSTDSSEFVFHAMIFGSVVGGVNNDENGVLIFENSAAERAIITHNNSQNSRTNNLVGYKYNEDGLISATDIYVDLIYVYIADRYVDREQNILIMGDLNFVKINAENQLVFNEYLPDGCYYCADIIQNEELKYLTLSKYGYDDIFELRRYENNGDLIGKEVIYNNNNSDIKCLDIAFWNEDEYIMLMKNSNNSQYYLERILISDPTQSETLFLEGEVNKLYRTDQGLIVCNLYDLDESNLIYVDEGYSIGFSEILNIDFYGVNNKLGIREFLNSITITTSEELFAIDKSGNLIGKKEFCAFDHDFTIQSINKSADNTVVLAHVETKDSQNNPIYYNIMFLVDELGNIIE